MTATDMPQHTTPLPEVTPPPTGMLHIELRSSVLTFHSATVTRSSRLTPKPRAASGPRSTGTRFQQLPLSICEFPIKELYLQNGMIGSFL